MVEKLVFNLSNFIEQEFPFPLKLIEFVNNEADAEIKQKLDRCCKYFFKEAPYFIVDSLVINEDTQRFENETFGGCIDFIDDNEIKMFLEKVKFIWITKKLNLFFYHSIVGKFTKKISRCDATEISISKADLTFHTFVKLTKSGKVESLDLSNNSSIVSNYDESPVPLENVLVRIPNARIIRLSECHVTKETMTKLLEIPFKQKFTELSFNKVDGPICANLFFEFIKNHVHPINALFNVNFTFENKEFHEELHDKLKIAKSGENLPTCGTMEEFVNNETTVVALPPNKKQKTWMDIFHWLFCNCFRKKPPVISKDEPQLNEQPGEYVPLLAAEEPILIDEPTLADEDEPKLVEDSAPLKKAVYNNENIERQYTAFPYPHMCYIRETAGGETWKKLERTCKFFHEKNPYLMVDYLTVGADGKITLMVDNKKWVFENGMEMDKIGKPLWITNFLNLNAPLNTSLALRNERIVIDNFLKIKMKYMKVLCESGKVRFWNSISGVIKNDNKEIISLQELLVHLPNTEIILANVCGINSQNSNESIIVPQRKNIKKLVIIFDENPINADQIFDVLVKSLAPKALVGIGLMRLANEMDVPQFKSDLKAKLDTWKPQIEKPTVRIVYHF